MFAIARRKITSILSASSGNSVRLFSISSKWGGDFGAATGVNAFGLTDDFERRIFSDAPTDNSQSNSFYRRLDQGYDTTFQDGLDAKLKKAATWFDYDEMYDDNYKYRPDTTFFSGTTYDVQDLDLTKPAVQKFSPKKMVDTNSAEVLEKADFRNVRFLAEFITEAGIIIKRSKTGISAKAQRKLAREIKTARAFGLMPFITMGTKSFVPGRSMKEDDPSEHFDDSSVSLRLDNIGLDKLNRARL